MKIHEAIRKMHDESGLGYGVVSEAIGQPPRYLGNILDHEWDVRLDVFASIVQGFGYELVVTGDEIYVSIQPDDSTVTKAYEIPAADAVRRIVDKSPYTTKAVAKRSKRTVAIYNGGNIIPTSSAFIDIAEACDCSVFVFRNDTRLYLSEGNNADDFLFDMSYDSNQTATTSGVIDNMVAQNATEKPAAEYSSGIVPQAISFDDSIAALAKRTGLSDYAVGRKAGKNSRFIEGVRLGETNPSAITYTSIVNAYGFELKAIKPGGYFSVKKNKKEISSTQDCTAKEILPAIVTASGLSIADIARLAGIGEQELADYLQRCSSYAPDMQTLLTLANICGYMLILDGDGTSYQLNCDNYLPAFARKRSVDGQHRAASSTTRATDENNLNTTASWKRRGEELQLLIDEMKTAGSPEEERRLFDESDYVQHKLKMTSNKDVRKESSSTSEKKPVAPAVKKPAHVTNPTGSSDKDGFNEQLSIFHSLEDESNGRSYTAGFTSPQTAAATTDASTSPVGFASPVIAPSVSSTVTLTAEPRATQPASAPNRRKPMTPDEAKLAEFKRRLLDLSMRNNLLNYKNKKTGTLNVLIPNLEPCYRRIVLNEKPMTFRESILDDEDAPIEQSPATSESVIVTERTSQADLSRSLRRLDSVARTSIEEQGINILYLAFGMLRWFDDANKEHKAPLVLAPVRLSRASARSSYVLQAGDDDPVVNPTLAFFLEQNHGITLPEFDKDSSLKGYLVSVANLVQAKKDWGVTTDVVLSTFQFQKLSMYHDLEARSAEILAHPIVKAIMGDRSALPEPGRPINPDTLSPFDNFQVVDADASQQAAIVAAHRGESFVLQGPPGTGKSQTITNIIADCLGSGKKVLFVSEKKAALDVVHRRLTQNNLDNFCLVLHSNKAGKKEVLAQLESTLKQYGTKPPFSARAETKLNNLVSLRNELNSYSEQVYVPLEPLGISPYEAIGIVSRFVQQGVPYLRCKIAGLENVPMQSLGEMVGSIRSFARALERLGTKPEDNPWNSMGIRDLGFGDAEQIINALSTVSSSSRELKELWDRCVDELEIDVDPTLESMKACANLLEDLSHAPSIPEGVVGKDLLKLDILIESFILDRVAVAMETDGVATKLAKLAGLDPELDLELEPEMLTRTDSVEEVRKQLAERLDTIACYKAWQKTPRWRVEETLSRLSKRMDDYSSIKAQVLQDYHPEILDVDFLSMEARFKTEYQSFLKRMFGQHGADIRLLTSLRRTNEEVSDEEALRILALLHELSNRDRALEDEQADFEAILCDCYRGMNTSRELISSKREAFDLAAECLDALEALYAKATEFDAKCEELSATFGPMFDSQTDAWCGQAKETTSYLRELRMRYGKPGSEVRLGKVEGHLCETSFSTITTALVGRLRTILDQCADSFELIDERQRGARFVKRSFDDISELAERAVASGTRALESSAKYNEAASACLALGLDGFANATLRDSRVLDPAFLDQLDDVFRHTFYRLWLGDVAWRQRPALRDFSSREQERMIGEFSSLDSEQMEIDRARVLAELFPRIPSPNVRARGKDEISILLRELNKKARIRPIRKLFADIPHAVLALKPCLMMSPLSVSTYLESATFQFDTVIFDEASQVRTEDALGVISRGKQVIIAGDSKQLPPTNFFAATVSEEGDEEEDDEYYEQAGSFDSVLDEAALLNSISLKWHYRSRDESLITFSNQEIYDGDLFTFPSSTMGGKDSGVEFEYVGNGVYEGSRKGNVIEASRVADLVFEHFAKYGAERSLGVIALGESQSRVIENELLRRRIQHPMVEAFFDTSLEEPFFIKNLENVQGDERDTIILSVGYAKGPNGKLSHNFGPINLEGGERRLNVAVTRARINLKLVSSMDPSEIDPSRVTNRGPQLLRDYLAYAKLGTVSGADDLTREYGYIDDDAFVEVVRTALESHGYQVDEQVGRSGCKIDLAVKHPEHEGCYCLGIVCDGSSYHAASTARDRDRLRNAVLNGMGWKLIHLWACEWLTNPEGQEASLIREAERAVKEFVPPVEREMPDIAEDDAEELEGDASEQIIAAEPDPVEEPEITDEGQDEDYLSYTAVIEEHLYGFQDYSTYEVEPYSGLSDIDIMKKLVFAQAPFSVDYFTQQYRKVRFPKSERVTSQIRDSAIGFLKTKLNDYVQVRSENGKQFVFRKDQRVLLPRVAGDRTIEEISPSELRAGVLQVLKNYMGELDKRGLIEETSAAFEFKRRGRIIEEKIGEAIGDLRRYGNVKVIDGTYVAVSR